MGYTWSVLLQITVYVKKCTHFVIQQKRFHILGFKSVFERIIIGIFFFRKLTLECILHQTNNNLCKKKQNRK